MGEYKEKRIDIRCPICRYPIDVVVDKVGSKYLALLSCDCCFLQESGVGSTEEEAFEELMNKM